MSSGRMKEIEEGMREEERENVILEIHKQSHGRLNKKEEKEREERKRKKEEKERAERISAPAVATI